MNTARMAALAALFGLASASAASAQGIVDEYCTKVSRNDKVASDGYALTDAASILRQDRANYHKFGIRDPGDQGDSTFKSAKARSRIPAMLDNGDTDAATLRKIVSGNPRVCVEIYRNSLFVYSN